MKKFVAAFDSLRYSTSTCEYAIRLARKSNAHLVGVFLDDPSRHNYKIYDLITEDGNSAARQKKLEQADIKTRKNATGNFETACKNAGLAYTVRHDKSTAIHELLQESIYADLLILDSSEKFTAYKEKIPSGFIRDFLTQVRCPVLLVPHKFKPIKNLVLLFDGEPASVHAIKMLSYTLGPLKQEPTEVVSVKNPDQPPHLPDNSLMKEFMKRHFPKAHYTVLKGVPEMEIVNYLKLQQNCPLVVLGAYQRGMVSRWFRASMADVLMRDLKLPLFIAHTN